MRVTPCFSGKGGRKSVRDENLKEPTLLVFEFDGSRVFHFCVYDHRSMCKRVRFPIEKEVIQVESEEEEDDDDERDEETDDDDDDDMVVEDEESTEGLDESPKTKERGGTSRRRSYLKTNSYKRDEYLDNKLNPTFPIDTTKQQTDYNLTFPKVVIVRDKLGKLKRKISVWKNRTVNLNGFGSIMRRNFVKPGDRVVCELKMVDGYPGLVREIKVHIIKG